MPDWLRRTRRRTRRRRTARRAGRGRCARSPAAVGPAVGDRQPPEHPLVDEPELRASARSARGEHGTRTRRCRSSGTPGGCTSIWPLMPRWPRRASPLSRASQRYLPRRWAAVNVRPVSRAAKSAGPARWRRTGRGCSTSTETIGRPRTWASRPRADDLDLGKLRHRRPAALDAGLGEAARARRGAGSSALSVR